MGEEGRTRREEGKTVHDKQSYESIRRRWTNNDEEEGEDEVMLICVFRKSARTNLVGGGIPWERIQGCGMSGVICCCCFCLLALQ